MGGVKRPQLRGRWESCNYSNSFSAPCRDNQENAKGVGLADLQDSFLSVSELQFQIERVIGTYFFCLGWGNAMLGYVLSVSRRPNRTFSRLLNVLLELV